MLFLHLAGRWHARMKLGMRYLASVREGPDQDSSMRVERDENVLVGFRLHRSTSTSYTAFMRPSFPSVWVGCFGLFCFVIVIIVTVVTSASSCAALFKPRLGTFKGFAPAYRTRIQALQMLGLSGYSHDAHAPTDRHEVRLECTYTTLSAYSILPK
jgi:hypothetical protein